MMIAQWLFRSVRHPACPWVLKRLAPPLVLCCAATLAVAAPAPDGDPTSTETETVRLAASVSQAQKPAAEVAATSPSLEAVAPGDTLKLAFTFRPQAGSETRTIRSGDRLAVTWHFAAIPTDKPYKIRAGDWVHLNFRYSPLLSQFYTKTVDSDVIMLSKPYTVEPNGTLVLPGVPEPVPVLGKSTDEIRKIVEEKYKGILEVPEVGVSVEPQFVYEKTLQALVQPAYSQTPILYVPVPPDGKLSLPLLSALKAEGKTVQQLSQELTEHYHKLDYEYVTVNVWYDQVADGRNAELRELLAGKENNPLTVEVPAGGHIALPLISDYPAQGKSLAAIGAELTAQYQAKGMDQVEVSAWIGAARPRGVRILGEVKTPGIYPVRGELDLWGAIALAGGFMPQADEGAVRVARSGKGGARTYSFSAYMQSGDPGQSPALGGDELIFVPRKR